MGDLKTKSTQGKWTPPTSNPSDWMDSVPSLSTYSGLFLFADWDTFLEFTTTEFQDYGMPYPAAASLYKEMKKLVGSDEDLSALDTVPHTGVGDDTLTGRTVDLPNFSASSISSSASSGSKSGSKREFKSVQIIYEDGERQILKNVNVGSKEDIKNWLSKDRVAKNPDFVLSYWSRKDMAWANLSTVELDGLPDPLKISMESQKTSSS